MPITIVHNPFSPSCNSCNAKSDLMDLTVGRTENGGMTITLCHPCRNRLLEMLDALSMEQFIENVKARFERNRR